MLDHVKIAGVAILASLVAVSAQAAQIQFTGSYVITDDAGAFGVSFGDTFAFTGMSVTSADPTYSPEVVFGSTLSDFSITASIGENVGTAFSIGADSFIITSTTVATATGPFSLVSGGLGDLNADAGSWYVSFLGTAPSGGFLGLIETPPGDIPGQVPVPAALPLLVGGLGLLAFVRRRKTA